MENGSVAGQDFTNARGAFTLVLRPGRYRVEALRAPNDACTASATITLTHHARAVTLVCPVP
jgi:hypothetical protein